MSTSYLAASAASWGVLMALSPVLQIRAILQRRSSSGVSIAYFAVLAVGFCLWIAYGVALGNAALVVPNCVALLLALATIGVAAAHRQPAEA